MPRRKKKKKSRSLHYIQLKTYRKFPNQVNYVDHVSSLHSKIQPIAHHIQTTLDNKWIQIQRPAIREQLNEIHREEIQREFFHQIISLKTRKLAFFEEQFQDDDRFLREIFRRQIQITDQLIDLHQQIELGDRHIYEYRLEILKFDFEKEKNDLEHLFIHQHFQEFQNQIDLLTSLDEEDYFQQLTHFQTESKQLHESFFKDMHHLHQQYQTRIQREETSTGALNRKIEQTRTFLGNLDEQRGHLREKFEHLKQCANPQEKQSNLRRFPNNRNQIHFRRLVTLVDDVQRKCQKKLDKIERLFSLINQCEKLEFEDEKLLLSSLKTAAAQLNPFVSQLHYLDHCHFEFDASFDQLTFFWKRFAHVQTDLFIRIKEKQTLLQQQNLLRTYAFK